MTDLLRSGVGGSLALWILMCAVDPVLMGLFGTVDIPWLDGSVIYGDRLVWVVGQGAVLAALGWLLIRHGLAEAVLPAMALLLLMLARVQTDRGLFWGAGTIEQALFQAALLAWLYVQRQRADRLAAGALFLASLVGLVLMADAQLRMAGMEIVAGDPALAFTVAYGTWSIPVIPFIGILLLAACAAIARRDPTWMPMRPGG